MNDKADKIEGFLRGRADRTLARPPPLPETLPPPSSRSHPYCVIPPPSRPLAFAPAAAERTYEESTAREYAYCPDNYTALAAEAPENDRWKSREREIDKARERVDATQQRAARLREREARIAMIMRADRARERIIAAHAPEMIAIRSSGGSSRVNSRCGELPNKAQPIQSPKRKDANNAARPQLEKTKRAKTDDVVAAKGSTINEEETNKDISPLSNFPLLSQLGADGDDHDAEIKRRVLLTELLQFDEKRNKNKTAVIQTARFQIICVPKNKFTRTPKRKNNPPFTPEELNNFSFHNCNIYHNVMSKFIAAWARYCDGTTVDATKMILFFMARHYPQCYVQNVKNSETSVADISTGKQEEANEFFGHGDATYLFSPSVKLPLDFVSHDGTADLSWNIRYTQLMKYKEEFGNCKVYTGSKLGGWVVSQRTMKEQLKGEASPLKAKRIQLLDDIGFTWCRGKDRRKNCAIASKIVYPQLTIRETLYLGGFEDEELDVIPNPKHTWRSEYVKYKDQVVAKVKAYDPTKRKNAYQEIEEYIKILEGGDKDQFGKVFGGCSDLLPQFLEAANERASQGIFEKSLRVSLTEGEKNRSTSH